MFFLYLYASDIGSNDLNLSYILFFILFIIVFIMLCKFLVFFICEKIKMHNQIIINNLYLEKEKDLYQLRCHNVNINNQSNDNK